jgi:two-component system chemotaxis sensor kinase CheA
LLPLFGLADVLAGPDAFGPCHEPQPRIASVIAVLQGDNRRFAMRVDQVLDTEEIVVEPLPERLRGVGIYAGATLLGDGRVSLILDVQGIARQWLTGQSLQADPEPVEPLPAPVGASGQVLVVGIGGERRVAIPLMAVTRLERVRGEVVERVGGREVMQYRGAIVPFIRLDHFLGGRVDLAGGELGQHEPFVVIFTRGARTVAVAVQEVLDIVDDDQSRHSQIDDHGAVGSTVLAQRVTELLDVRQVVLSADPSFFDTDAGDGSPAPGAASATFGEMGV